MISHYGALRLDDSATASAIASLSLSYGLLTGSGDLHITHSLAWTDQGIMAGAGTTVVDPGAAATLSFRDWKPGFLRRDLDNWGTITFSHGALYMAATIINNHLINDNTEAGHTGAPAGFLDAARPHAGSTVTLSNR